MCNVDSKNNKKDNVIHFNFRGGRMINTTQSLARNPDARWNGAVELFKARATRPRRHGGQAKAFTPNDLRRVFAFLEKERSSPEADTVKICLSFMAGLRACEISGLHVSDVTNPDGSTADFIRVRANVTKNGRPREIPMCPELKQAIEDFRAKYPDSEWLAVSDRYNVVKHQSANSVTVWFHWLYRQCGLEKCSSHSGRRTFITTACRNLPPDCSLRDVQVIAGHARLDTTQAYIECSPSMRSVTNIVGAMLSDADGEGTPE
jgi:integrase/recombinase XerD